MPSGRILKRFERQIPVKLADPTASVARQMETDAYVLGIRGYAFNEFGERLSEQAANNLDAAIQFIEGVITHDLFEDAVTVKETKRD